MAKVNLPLGIEFFDMLRGSDCYYIDKTGFIKELLSETFSVNLITRPRRFGKTLTISTLAEFLDIRKDSRKLFKGLEIEKDTELCRNWMNQWPLLFLSLKDVDGRKFDKAYELLKQTISNLCIEHSYLEYSESTDPVDKEVFNRLKSRKGDDTEVQCALYTLMRMMKAHYGKNVILLVDEYDVPLAKASDNGYYDEMLDVIRSFLGMVWKSNPFLKFAVVTGCLRIAKESIFTGANNFISSSISSKKYNRYFGFSEQEVFKLLTDTGLEVCLPEMKKWYDGYRFGGKEIYCPWDVINYVRDLMDDIHAKPSNFWKNTSHNSIIRRFIDLPNMAVHDKFETLLAGGLIQETIEEDLTYDIANSSEDNLWSILYLTGYLTQAAPGEYPKEMNPENGTTVLRIPNEEIKTIFADTVAKWFTDVIMARDRRDFFKKWWNGDTDQLTQDVSNILFDTISYFDYKEDYYHAFLTGLFAGAGYEVSSNSEQGTGRADIVVKDRANRRAIIIEAKRSANEGELEKNCDKALAQIEKMQYAKKLQLQGYQIILCYGAAFYAKSCLIKS